MLAERLCLDYREITCTGSQRLDPLVIRCIVNTSTFDFWKTKAGVPSHFWNTFDWIVGTTNVPQ